MIPYIQNAKGTDNKNVHGEPKYKSQFDIFNRVKSVFEKALIERDKLIKEQVHDSMKDKIIILILELLCIGATYAAVTHTRRNGEWEPFYDIIKASS